MHTISLRNLVFLTLCLATLSLTLTVCTRRAQLEISQTDFKNEIRTQENLKFTFSQALPVDSLIGRWDSTSYLRFTPAVAGKFKWVSTREVIFSPTQGFAPGTDYQVKPSPSLAKLSKTALPVNTEQKIQFHTQYLRLEGLEMYWSRNDRNTNLLHIALKFNYAVHAESLQNLVQIKTGDKNLSAVRVASSGVSDMVMIIAEETNDTPLNKQLIAVSVGAGVRCANSQYASKKPMSYEGETPDRNQLQVLGVVGEYNDNRPQIRVQFNQAISMPDVLSNLKLSPAAVYEVQTQDNGFVLRGNFSRSATYNLTLATGLRGIFGNTLTEPYTASVKFGAMQANITFVNEQGRYLTAKGNRNVGIRINNVPEVSLKIYKIFDQNMLYFLRQHASSNDVSGMDDWDGYGDLIVDKSISSKSLPIVNDFRVLNLDIDEITKDQKGIYALHISSSENQWLNARKIIFTTDIGLMVKETSQDILVFANQLLNAKPLVDAQIRLISKSNQVIEKANTDVNGVIVFKGIKQKYPDAEIKLITAYAGQDFGYIYLPHSEIQTEGRFETGGWRANNANLQAFLYGERNLYRPGEAVNFNVLVRDTRWQTPSEEMPIKIKCKLPNGRDWITQKGMVSPRGSHAFSWNLPANAPTGTYYAEIYTATDVLLASQTFSVEEFMPDRIKVRLKMTQSDYQTPQTARLQAGDSVRVLVNAVNLFGPPAVDKNYQLNFSLSYLPFVAKNYADYIFESVASSQSNRPELFSLNKEGTTDARGEVKASFFIPKEYQNLGLMRATMYATVFDETGRSVSRQTFAEVLTQNTFLGIKKTDTYVGTKQPLSIPLLALNAEQQPVASVARLQIVRYRWHTVLERSYGEQYEYVSKRKEEIVSEQAVNIAAGGSVVQFTPQFSGDYEVRLYLPDAQTYTLWGFYAYSYGTTDNAAFRTDPDGQVDIKLDKDNYREGEIAKALFTTPFNGRMLITIERDQVMEYKYLETANKTASLDIPLRGEHLPNVFVSATLIRPMSDGAIPLTVAHGFQNIKVEKADSKLDLLIEAVEKSESKQTQNIKVRTRIPEPDVEITVAVVDEGILQIKNYETPDPHGFYFQSRALQVNSYDIYPQLFPEIAVNAALVGGDDGGFAGRANPLVNKRVKLVRFWSGTLHTNAQGEVVFPINIPQFSGSLRIMAVAHKGSKFGAAQKNMTIADPIVVSTGLPRFLSPNDEVQVPVTLFNTTANAAGNANIQLRVSDALEIVGNSSQSVNLAANGEALVHFVVRAKPMIDTAKVSITAQVLGRTFGEDLDVTVRPTAGLLKQTGGGSIPAGASAEIDMRHQFFSESVKARLVVSRSPLVQFANQLEYLVQYPHGCLEQIVSGAFPQLYVQDLMRVVSPQKQNIEILNADIRDNIQEAILKLQSLQNYSGGLSYWQNGDTHFFGTAYAAHFMIEAEKAGYAVDKNVLERMLEYLQNRADSRYDNLRKYSFVNNEGTRQTKRIVRKENIYALYVLALAGRADIATMNYYQENIAALALDSRYLLAMAYALNGDKAQTQRLLPNAFTDEYADNELSGSFASVIRDQALVLNALIEADENSLQIPALARDLTERLLRKADVNTQEAAFVLMSLGKLAKKTANNNSTGTIAAGSQVIANFAGQELNLQQGIAGNKVRLNAANGTLYYFWQLQGVSKAATNARETDKGIKVRRTFYDQRGNIIKNNTFRQNDLVVVRLSISTDALAGEILNVVLTDMLPAGLEIENPRVTASRSIPWVRTSDSPDYMDVRDDRLNLFVDARTKTRHFYYLTRAVSIGTYTLGAVSADAMYSSEYYSYHGSGTVRIVARDAAQSN